MSFIKRIMLPAALALATVSLTACKTREQAAKRYLEQCGKKPTPALISKYVKLAKPRWFSNIRGYYINDKCLPNIVVKQEVVERIVTVPVKQECPMCPAIPPPGPMAPDRPPMRRRRRNGGQPMVQPRVQPMVQPMNGTVVKPRGMIEI